MFFIDVKTTYSTVQIFTARLFDSITVEGKKELFKKPCLSSEEGTFSTNLVKYDLILGKVFLIAVLFWKFVLLLLLLQTHNYTEFSLNFD